MKNNIGEARRDYAERNGKFTQEDAAKFFGVSLSTYKKWEQGQGMMNGEQLALIAIKYDVSVDYLLGREQQVITQIQASEISEDERELVELYRRLTDRGKHAVIVGLRDFAGA